MTQIQLTIVIPSHNRDALLRRTVTSLGQCCVPDATLRTIVIENGGRFGAADVVHGASNWLNAEYHYCQNGNKSEALNQVLKLTSTGLMVFFDDDVRLRENVLTAYVDAARNLSAGRFFAGPMEIDYEAIPEPWLIKHLPDSARGWTWKIGQPIDQPLAMGCNWAAFVTDLKRVGGFDQRRGPGCSSGSVGQEREMQRVLLENDVCGEYVPEALVWHYVPHSRCSSTWLLDRYFKIGVNAGLSRPAVGWKLFGVPVRLVQDCIRQFARAKWDQIWGRREAAFVAKASYWKLRGKIKGQRLLDADAQDTPQNRDT